MPGKFCRATDRATPAEAAAIREIMFGTEFANLSLRPEGPRLSNGCRG
jgi:hypothetical protein